MGTLWAYEFQAHRFYQFHRTAFGYRLQRKISRKFLNERGKNEKLFARTVLALTFQNEKIVHVVHAELAAGAHGGDFLPLPSRADITNAPYIMHKCNTRG